MMHMTFYWGRKVTLLFDFWKTETWADYSLTLIVCLLFSIFYQYLEHCRLKFKKVTETFSNNHPATTGPDPSPISAPLLLRLKFARVRGSVLARFLAALLFGINSAIGYMTMLAVMSFNGGVFLAVVLGLSVGYLLFRSAHEDDLLVLDNPCACA